MFFSPVRTYFIQKISTIDKYFCINLNAMGLGYIRHITHILFGICSKSANVGVALRKIRVPPHTSGFFTTQTAGKCAILYV